MLYLVAFLTGLAGSFHCIGMCGPIALALPIGGQTNWEAFFSRIIYNFGRIITYSVLGAIFSIFGQAFILAGFQNYLSIAIGILLFLIVFSNQNISFSPFRIITQKITKAFSPFLRAKTRISFLLLGMVNGLLPCGFVYIALVGSLAANSMGESALFMSFFGLGTAPLLFFISIVPKYLSNKTRQNINKYLPAYTFILALFFMLRGLNLGIPYVSPKFEKEVGKSSITICHSTKTD